MDGKWEEYFITIGINAVISTKFDLWNLHGKIILTWVDKGATKMAFKGEVNFSKDLTYAHKQAITKKTYNTNLLLLVMKFQRKYGKSKS